MFLGVNRCEINNRIVQNQKAGELQQKLTDTG